MGGNQPNILLIDIETAPNVSYTWGKWQQDVIDFKETTYILCFGYKWLGGKTDVIALPDFRGYKPGGRDEKLLKILWNLLDRADIVIAHNGISFDIKKIYTRFAQFKMPPPSPFRTVDTLRVCRGVFGFNSNKLDDLGRDLNEGRKIHHEGFPMWLGCMNGEKKWWNKMKRYCAGDIDLLERVYYRIRPFIKNHPNLGMWINKTVCPNCGSKNLVRRGYRINQTTKYARLCCQACGAWSRARFNEQEYPVLTNA